MSITVTATQARPGVAFRDLPRCTRNGCHCARDGYPHEFDFEFLNGQPVHGRRVAELPAQTERSPWSIHIEAVGTGPWNPVVRTSDTGGCPDAEALARGVRKAEALCRKLNRGRR